MKLKRTVKFLLRSIPVLVACFALCFSLLGCLSPEDSHPMEVLRPTELSAQAIPDLNQQWLESLEGQDLDAQFHSTSHVLLPGNDLYVGSDISAGFHWHFFNHGVSITAMETLVLESFSGSTMDGFFEIGRLNLVGSPMGDSMIYATIWKSGAWGYHRQFMVMHYEDPEKLLSADELDSILNPEVEKLEQAFRSGVFPDDLYAEDSYFYWGRNEMVQGGVNIVRNYLGQGDYDIQRLHSLEVSENIIYEIGDGDPTIYLMVWQKTDHGWKAMVDAFLD